MSMEDFLKNATIQAQGHIGSSQNFADDDEFSNQRERSQISNDSDNAQSSSIVEGLSSFNPLEDNPTIRKKQHKFRYELDLRTLICAIVAFLVIVLVSAFFSYQAGIAYAAKGEGGTNSDNIITKKQVKENEDGSSLGADTTNTLKTQLEQCQANLASISAASASSSPSPPTPEQAVDANGVVNLNLATLEDLQKLKGVGPSTAQKILDYRTQNGNFKSVEELKEVKGIGEATFEKLKDKIKVK